MALFGDKNSPKTSQQSASTTITKTDNRVVSGNSGFTSIGGNTDISGVSGNVRVTTTDQGAVAAGLQIALAGLDSANTVSQSAIAAGQNETSQAVGVAETVAQGQQNTTIKYVMYIFLGCAAAFAVIYSHKKG